LRNGSFSNGSAPLFFPLRYPHVGAARCFARNNRLGGTESATPHFVDKSTTLPLSYQAAVPMPAAPSTIETMTVEDPTTDDAAPSRLDLLQHAAEKGFGPRLSLDNIGMTPTDPILAKKREPGVIERRTRFRRIVKVGIGLCAGFCLFATAATALSSNKPTSSEGTSSAMHSTAPASVVSEKASLEIAATTKAEKTATAAPAIPAAPAKRTAKRR
jgi:hypothetical protein